MRGTSAPPPRPAPRSARLPAAGVLIAMLMALAACVPGERSAAQAVIRDSAGIQIVENTAFQGWRSGRGWRVSERPAAEFGSLELESGTGLFGVRGAVRLSDGRVVVADGGSGQLRFFAPDGEFLFAAGREGDGPGEFRMLTALARGTGDTLLAYDSRSGRVSVFTPSGAFHRSMPVGTPRSGGIPLLAPVGWLDSGTFVAQATRVDEGLQPPAGGEGRLSYRPRAELLFFTRGGETAKTVSGFAGNESVTFLNTPGTGQLRIRTVPVPFLKTLHAAAAARRVAVGATDAYEFRLYTPEGTLERIVRGPGAPRPVTPRAVEAWVDEQLAAVRDPARRRERRREYEGLPIPDRMPAFESFVLDGGGRLWVREYDAPGARPPAARWSVYDQRGILLGPVALPLRFQPLEIGEDYILGSWRDELDVEQVRLYVLARPAGTR